MRDIYCNGTIFTGEAGDAEAMAVEQGRITGIGSLEKPDVMAGIQCAVTRTTLDGTKEFLKDQAFSVGKFADFTVLEEDIRKCPHDRIKDAAILETYVGGVCVYKKENS